MFRDLRADEIEVRVSTIKSSGLKLLLYKDARVDQNILDETCGPFGWQREHQMIGDQLYCTVSIYNSKLDEWISKQDVGSYGAIEKDKSVASDSFKRACFNWGIGRELYTAPHIWVSSDSCKIEGDYRNYRCSDRFRVEQIIIEEKKIVALSIKNDSTGKRVFCWDGRKKNAIQG